MTPRDWRPPPVPRRLIWLCLWVAVMALVLLTMAFVGELMYIWLFELNRLEL